MIKSLLKKVINVLCLPHNKVPLKKTYIGYENSVPFSYPMAEDQWMPAIHKGNQCVQCSINQEFLSQMNTMAFQVNQIFMNQNQINEVTPRTSNLESQPASSMLISTEEKIVERNKNLEYVKTILGVENQEFITETEGGN